MSRMYHDEASDGEAEKMLRARDWMYGLDGKENRRWTAIVKVAFRMAESAKENCCREWSDVDYLLKLLINDVVEVLGEEEAIEGSKKEEEKADKDETK